MAWRLAKSLDTLRTQVNASWPKRSKASDGTVGDLNHSSRSSDHNPSPAGVVCAMDITHDPKSGCDSYALAAALVASKDARIKYIISNGRIVSGTNQGQTAWKWRKYTGANPHNHHVHISVKSNAANYDSTAKWDLSAMASQPVDKAYVTPPPTLRKGSKGDAVKRLQTLLKTVKVDGDFGTKTQEAVVKFQASKKLVDDGVAGPQTWAALGA